MKKMKIPRKTQNRGVGLCAALALVAGIGFTSSASAQTTPDLMVGYTKRAKDSRGGESQIKAQIRQGITRMNRAHANSLTKVRVTERALIEFPYNEGSRNLSSVLGDWRNGRMGTAFGRSQRSWENFLGRDLACIISTAGGVRGVAYLNNPYSAVTVGQARFHTLGHEIGHNYTAGHAQGNTMRAGSGNQLPGDRSTFLASGGKSNGSIVDYYSNPNVSYLGARTGTADKNNAARILNNRFARQNSKSKTVNPPPGWVQLEWRHSGRCVDNKGGTARGTEIHQWDCGASANRHFRFEDKGGGYYLIRSQRSNLCLDMTGNSANGTKIHQWTCNASNANQGWRLSQRGGSNSPWFWLQAQRGGKCMDVAQRSTARGARIHQWGCGDAANKQLRYRF